MEQDPMHPGNSLTKNRKQTSSQLDDGDAYKYLAVMVDD
jgi:hypothetical protein